MEDLLGASIAFPLINEPKQIDKRCRWQRHTQNNLTVFYSGFLDKYGHLNVCTAATMDARAMRGVNVKCDYTYIFNILFLFVMKW